MFGRIKNVIKNLGLTAAALALAVGLASAPAASASSLAASDSPDPITAGETGKLVVYVGFDSVSDIQQATVTVYNEMGGVAKALAYPNQEVAFELNEGLYKVVITSGGYETFSEEVKVVAGEATLVKVQLKKISRLPVPGLSRSR